MKFRNPIPVLSCLSLFALACELNLYAVIIPVAEDTSSSAVGSISATTGKATTLSVSATRQAFVRFDLSDLASGNISGARLILYVTKTTVAGDLIIRAASGDWHEATLTAPAPTSTPDVVATIAASELSTKRFIVVDVTAPVAAWLKGAPNYGFAISTASANLVLGAKEGLGTGFPALLEIETGATIVNGGSIQAGTVGSSQLAVGSVGAAQLASGSVGAAQLAPGSVTGSAIADGSIGLADLSSSIGSWSSLGGNAFRPSGNVGIGTSTPSAPLQVTTGNRNVWFNSVSLGALGNGGLLSISRPGDGVESTFLGTSAGPADDAVLAASGSGSELRLVSGSAGSAGFGFYLNTSLADAFAGNRPAPAVKIDGSGNLGINAAPNSKLHVNVTSASQLSGLRVQVDGGSRLTVASNGGTSIGGFNDNPPPNGLYVSGSVGIGEPDPAQAKLVVSGTGTDTIDAHATYTSAGPALNQPSGTSSDVSIKASDAINASAFRAISDERIKNVAGRSDSSSDLDTLRGIEVTDYTFKDTLAKGNRPQKKVIAQQVETIYPQAISRSTDVVPDIYQPATICDGWINLTTDLQPGDRVRLIGDKEQGIYQVFEVRKDAFRTAFAPAAEKVFVYGREVKDFRSVDYEAIAMLNVSATQELARRLEAKDEEIAELRAKLAALEIRDQASEARLSRLENAMDNRTIRASYNSK